MSYSSPVSTNDCERAAQASAVALVPPSAVSDHGVKLVVPEADPSSTSTTPSPPPVTRRRHKVATSCNRCRQNKRKCDGDLPCSNCKRANVDCRYTDAQQSRSLWGDKPLSPEKVMGHRRAMQEGVSTLSLPQELLPPVQLTVSSAPNNRSNVSSEPSSPPCLEGLDTSANPYPSLNPPFSPLQHRRQSHHSQGKPGQHVHSSMDISKPFVDIQQSHCDDCAADHSQGQTSSVHGSMATYHPPIHSSSNNNENLTVRWNAMLHLLDGMTDGGLDLLQSADFVPTSSTVPGWGPDASDMMAMPPVLSSDQLHDATTTQIFHPTVAYSNDPSAFHSFTDASPTHQSPWSDASYLSPTLSASTFHDTPSPNGAGLMNLPSPPSLADSIPQSALTMPMSSSNTVPDQNLFASPIHSDMHQVSTTLSDSALLSSFLGLDEGSGVNGTDGAYAAVEATFSSAYHPDSPEAVMASLAPL